MSLGNMNLRNISLDRRQKLRIVPNELVFLQLERDDGGTVLDVSEGGLGFETFAPVSQNGPVHFWFSLNLRDRIEAWGEVVWTNAARKCGGLRFLRLSEEARQQIRRWMTEFSRRQAAEAESVRKTGPESRPDKFGKGKFDAVAAFVSKARPRHSTLFGSLESSVTADTPAPLFEEPTRQLRPSELVPVQKYVAAKRKQLIFGVVLGICISAMFAVGALKFSSYLRQNRGPEKAAGEARTVRPEPEIKQPAPAATAPAVTSPNSADIFAGSNQKTSSSSAHVLHPQGATATLSARSHTTEPAKPAIASAPPPAQPHSREIASKTKPPSRTPAELWASVQAGNSKAALELAELYIQGDGVPQNCTQARVLLMVASEKRNTGAIKRLQELDKTGCPGE